MTTLASTSKLKRVILLVAVTSLVTSVALPSWARVIHRSNAADAYSFSDSERQYYESQGETLGNVENHH